MVGSWIFRGDNGRVKDWQNCVANATLLQADDSTREMTPRPVEDIRHPRHPELHGTVREAAFHNNSKTRIITNEDKGNDEKRLYSTIHPRRPARQTVQVLDGTSKDCQDMKLHTRMTHSMTWVVSHAGFGPIAYLIMPVLT